VGKKDITADENVKRVWVKKKGEVGKKRDKKKGLPRKKIPHNKNKKTRGCVTIKRRERGKTAPSSKG